MFSRDMEKRGKKIQMKLLKMNNTMSEKICWEKDMLGVINFRLDTAEARMSKPEDIALVTTQNETQRKKRQGKKNEQGVISLFPLSP